jgi:MYXO-CTERM domain-containing protein
MSIGDSEGSGPQWAYVNFNAFAFGGMGAYNDTETAFVSLSYENDTAASASGLFSGYVSSFASSGIPVVSIPEPPESAMLAAALLAAGFVYRRRGRRNW